jgi:uncharacterized protein YdhG (YjbR/CyaY superfamily)
MKRTINTINDYLANQDVSVRYSLEKLRHTIKKAVPEAEETISYQMPAFKYLGMLAYFAAFKNHYSLFVKPKVLQVFKDDLKQYELSKSAIRIPKGKPVPVQLVTKIIKFGAKENLDKAKAKGKLKSKQKS